MLIEFDVVSIPNEVNPTGLIKIFPVKESLETLTALDVPMPTFKFGFNDKSILSLLSNSWDVDIETVVFTFSILPVTCSKSVSNENKSLSALVNDMKYTSLNSSPIPVLIPIVLMFLFTAYKVSGKLNVVAGLVSVDTAILEPTGFENLIFWFVFNRWFSRWIFLVDKFLDLSFPPKENETLVSVPSIVPKPTDCLALKNIFLLFVDSNLLIDLSIVNEFDINLTWVPFGCEVAKADPEVLSIVRTFKSL